jgi:hypothetical protein
MSSRLFAVAFSKALLALAADVAAEPAMSPPQLHRLPVRAPA